MGKKPLSVEKQYFNTINKIEEILRHHGPRKKLVNAWKIENPKYKKLKLHNTNVHNAIDYKHQALICQKLFRYERIITKLRKKHPAIIQSQTSATRNQEQESSNRNDITVTANEDTPSDNQEPHQNDNDTDDIIETATNQDTFTNHQETLNDQVNDDTVFPSCQNCFRKQSPFLIEKYGHESSYNITFIRHRSDEIKRRPFTTVIRTTSHQNLRLRLE